jgi:predicted transglutaminase-like cysteine proteinase
MLAQSSLRAGARMAAVVVAMVLCAGATLARAPSQVQLAPTVLAPLPPPMGLAGRDTGSPVVEVSPPKNGPFGLAAAESGSFSARWSLLQPSIRFERQILAVCRTNPAACPDAAVKFSAIVDAARNRDGLARVGEVNRAVNLAIRSVSDQDQYGVPDIWASPLMTFGSGAGDCEDYAIAKYVALREAGMASADLRLVVVYNRPAHENHMVAAARVDGRWRILDNRTTRLVADEEIADYAPLAVLDSADGAPAVAAAPSPSPPLEAAGGTSAETTAESAAKSWDVPGFTVAL